MTTKRYASIVLAAGRSTRMRGRRSKLLHEVAGIPVIARVARQLRRLELPENLFVVSHQKEEVMAAAQAELPGAVSVDQGEPLGTGHAVRVGLGALSAHATAVLVLAGDVPLLRAETLRRLLDLHESGQNRVSFLTFEAADPRGYGRVIRHADGAVRAIVEDRECTPEQASVRECNAGIYVFERHFLEEEIQKLRTDNQKGEFYLTDVVMRAGEGGQAATWMVSEDEVMGVNTAAELSRAHVLANARNVRRHMDGGVVFLFPETVEVHEDVEIGPGTVVEGCVSLRGKTRIGAEVRLSAGCILQDTVVEEGACLLPYTIVEESRIESGARVGPFSRIRPGSVVGKRAHVGNFVELKKTILGEGVKANHLSYLGDAEVGAGSNVGAGTITCNYDGKNKFRTMIGENVFVGSDTQLIAPVAVGDGAYIGTGTTVFSDVPAGALAINPRKQENRPGWIPPYARPKPESGK